MCVCVQCLYTVMCPLQCCYCLWFDAVSCLRHAFLPGKDNIVKTLRTDTNIHPSLIAVTKQTPHVLSWEEGETQGERGDASWFFGEDVDFRRVGTVKGNSGQDEGKFQRQDVNVWRQPLSCGFMDILFLTRDRRRGTHGFLKRRLLSHRLPVEPNQMRSVHSLVLLSLICVY